MNNMIVNTRRIPLSQWVVDIVIALAAFGFGWLQLTMNVNLIIPDEMIRRLMGIQAIVPTASAVFFVALTTLPLVVRERVPWIVLIFTLVAWAILQNVMQGVSIYPIGPMVALFTVAYERPRVEAFIAGLIGVLVILLVPAGLSNQPLTQLTLVQNVAFMVAVAIAGYAFHVRQDYLDAAEERALEVARNREIEAERRVEEERVRIAREVHDITAHSLSAVSIQAAAAERLIDQNPEAAKEAISTARKTAKSALEDIRAMIGVLRTGDEKAESRPTEGTDRLPDLVDYLKNAGVDATLDESTYDRSKIPTFIDVGLFGIAREACTNIVRHAEANHAQILLSADNEFITLSVEDDGNGVPSMDPEASGGHGVQGMRERVRLLNGTFEAYNLKPHGFAIKAKIPIQRGEDIS